MKVINVHEAKTNFSKLLERVANGEQIILGKNGKPVAKLEQIAPNTKKHKITGGGFRLQEKLGKPLTPEYINKLARQKYK